MIYFYHVWSRKAGCLGDPISLVIIMLFGNNCQPITPPQNENLDSKIRHLQASELKFYDVRRA